MDRRTFLLSSGVVSIAALAGCSGGSDTDDDGGDDGSADDGGDDSDSATVTVGAGDDGFAFGPEELTVDAGTTVAFVWETDSHNIVVEDQPDDADWSGYEEIENSGFEYEHTFEVAGTYEYYCQPHQSQGMEGTIVVE